MEPTGTQSQAALLQAEADRLVTVALYHRPHEAHLARLRLEAEGLRCALAGEHMGGLACPPAVEIRLRVPAWQAPHARRVLEECEPRETSADWITSDLDALRCPRCGSLRVRTAPSGATGRWRVLGLPLPFLGRRAGCRHCGRRFRPT